MIFIMFSAYTYIIFFKLLQAKVYPPDDWPGAMPKPGQQREKASTLIYYAVTNFISS